MRSRVGTAGWAIPRADADAFDGGGTALQRYASRFTAVEVNSSFYRPHRRATWQRWRDSVPAGFRFSVKVPKEISHTRKLVDCAAPLDRFIDEVGALGDALAILLLQLPPKLAFDAPVVEAFLRSITGATAARIVCEPRHPSWFDAAPDALLRDHGVARVAADPAIVPVAAVPGGWAGLRYYRLHGSPRLYRSSYDDGRIDTLAHDLRAGADAAWCMFDNTASGAAIANALQLRARLSEQSGVSDQG